MTSPVAHPDAAPVAEAERIDAIDVLRGVALLGILVLNVQSFAMPGAAYFNPTAYGDLEGANLYVWVAGRMLADQKFMTIFSMLFGASIVLMTGRDGTGRDGTGRDGTGRDGTGRGARRRPPSALPADGVVARHRAPPRPPALVG